MTEESKVYIDAIETDWIYQPHIFERIETKTFIEDGPVILNRLSDEEYMQIPVFRQVLALCEFIQNEGSVKLTATGNLPQRVVFQMYSLGIPDSYYTKYPEKLKKETDSFTVRLARSLAEVGSLVRKKNKSLFLTRMGEVLLKDKHLLLKHILITFGHKLSWGYFDGFENKQIGQRCFGLSLLLMADYGNVPRESVFYSEKYFYRFQLLSYRERAQHCYIFRTFERFMLNLGLVDFNNKRAILFGDNEIVRKTDLFDKLLTIDRNYGKISYSTDSGIPIYKLRISIKGSSPLILRELLVPSDLSLENLHIVIQTVMGWTNSHLHNFQKDGKTYSVKYSTDDMWDEMGYLEYTGVKICDLLTEVDDKMIYEYDYGDSWIHNITLLEALRYDAGIGFLTCLSGERQCPAEDSGGIRGYQEILKIMKDQSHEEYEEYKVWLGDGFDPDHFDIVEVNKRLKGFCR